MRTASVEAGHMTAPDQVADLPFFPCTEAVVHTWPAVAVQHAMIAGKVRWEQLASRGTRWHRLQITGWYGRTERQVETLSGTAIWSHPGHHVPIRYVLVRDCKNEFHPQAFLCTDLTADPLDILRWFTRRWCMEVTFAEVRRHLGVETQRQWSDQAIARTIPALLGLFSLVAL